MLHFGSPSVPAMSPFCHWNESCDVFGQLASRWHGRTDWYSLNASIWTLTEQCLKQNQWHPREPWISTIRRKHGNKKKLILRLINDDLQLKWTISVTTQSVNRYELLVQGGWNEFRSTHIQNTGFFHVSQGGWVSRMRHVASLHVVLFPLPAYASDQHSSLITV